MKRICSLVLASAGIGSASLAGVPVTVSVQFGGLAHDMEIDGARQLIYVSVPTLDSVQVVSMSSWSIVDTIPVGLQPHGLSLGLGGDVLYVALNQTGAVAVVQLETATVSEIPVPLLETLRTYDVVEAVPGRLYVTGNPSSSARAKLVEIALEEGNSQRVIENGRIFRCNPTLSVSPDRHWLYLGECFSPNSLYKFDLTLPDVPMILEDDHGSVSGTTSTALNPSGTRIHTSSGQALRTSSFIEDGVVGPGVPAFGGKDGRVYVATTFASSVRVYDTDTYLQVGTIPLACPVSMVRAMRVLGPESVLVLAADVLCGSVDLVPCGGTSSYCERQPNSTGAPARMQVLGSLSVSGAATELRASGVPPNHVGIFLAGTQPGAYTFGDGILCLNPLGGVYRLGAAFADGGGVARRLLDPDASVNPPITGGSTWYFQFWFRDSGPNRSNLSDGAEATFCH